MNSQYQKTLHSSMRFIIKALAVWVIILLLPLLFLYDDIKFDKVLFINNWLLCIGQGGIIALILNITMYIYKTSLQKQDDSNVVANIMCILNDIKSKIEQNPYDAALITVRLQYIEMIYMHIHNTSVKMSINKIIIGDDFIQLKRNIELAKNRTDSRCFFKLIDRISSEVQSIKL